MRISVFVTSYNQRDHLREALDSVIAQTLPPVQVIVVDDHSNDGSQDLISDYSRRYPDLITSVCHKRNTGVAQVRIDALKQVRGDYVTYVDGDDWFLPKKIENEAAALRENPASKIAFSNNEYVTSDGKERLWQWVDGEPVPEGDVFWNTFARAFPRRSLFRMELVEYAAWKRIGFHDPRLNVYEDFDMRIRLTKSLKVTYVDQVLSRIRVHERGLSKSDASSLFAAVDYLFEKNLSLLSDLSEEQRKTVKMKFAEWILKAHGRLALKEQLNTWHFFMAARFAVRLTRYTKLAKA